MIHTMSDFRNPPISEHRRTTDWSIYFEGSSRLRDAVAVLSRGAGDSMVSTVTSRNTGTFHNNDELKTVSLHGAASGKPMAVKLSLPRVRDIVIPWN
jgi:hypothetical protein